MSFLDTFITTQLFTFLFIFARIGGAMMIMPGFSDTTVPMQSRLYMALTLSFVLLPVLQTYMPTIPTAPIPFALLAAKELLTGIFIGLMSQIMLNAINLAGVMVSHGTSLSSAFTFNPQQAGQSTVISGFLSLTAIVLIMVTDLHHMLLIGLIDSYQVFPTQSPLLFGDMASSLAHSIGQSLNVGLMISAPFIIVAFGVFVAMGMVARLVPQIQVFILSIPVQVITGLIVLMTAVSAMMMYFLGEYQEFWQSFLISR